VDFIEARTEYGPPDGGVLIGNNRVFGGGSCFVPPELVKAGHQLVTNVGRATNDSGTPQCPAFFFQYVTIDAFDDGAGLPIRPPGAGGRLAGPPAFDRICHVVTILLSIFDFDLHLPSYLMG
jgi:hypothetical protein